MSKNEEAKALGRKAELLAKKAAREAAQKAAEPDYELELLELEDRLESEVGARGKAYEILDFTSLGEGFVAVRLVPGIRQMQTVFSNSKTTEATIDAFVTPCLAHPSPEAFREIVSRRPNVVGEVLVAISVLMGAKRSDTSGK